MMEEYSYIPAIPDRKHVLRRLGMKPDADGEPVNRDIESFLTYSESAFAVRGRAETFALEHLDEQKISVGGTEIESKQLGKLLRSSTKAYMMCASIQQKDVDKIKEAISGGQGLKALVLDAYASEYADAALDYIMNTKNSRLKRTGQKLTKMRFSAGYGDLDIKYQKAFYGLLDMSSMGVSINEKFLLIPEKSVIAIAGVE